MTESAIFDARFKHPMGVLVAGGPLSGKTTWTVEFLENLDRLVDKPINYIVWFYGQCNRKVEALKAKLGAKLTTVEGLPENFDDYIIPRSNGILVFDDVFLQLMDSNKIKEICAYKTQHANLSWIILMQNLFHNGKSRQTIYRCAHYLCIFNNALERSQVYTLAYKIMPGNQKQFLKIFEKAAERPHGYILIDGHQETPQAARFRTDIFKLTHQKIFIPQ